MNTLVIKWKVPNKKWKRSDGPLLDLLLEITDSHEKTFSDVEYLITKSASVAHYESAEPGVSWITSIESVNRDDFDEIKNFYIELREKYKNSGITIIISEEI